MSRGFVPHPALDPEMDIRTLDYAKIISATKEGKVAETILESFVIYEETFAPTEAWDETTMRNFLKDLQNEIVVLRVEGVNFGILYVTKNEERESLEVVRSITLPGEHIGYIWRHALTFLENMAVERKLKNLVIWVPANDKTALPRMLYGGRYEISEETKVSPSGRECDTWTKKITTPQG